MRAGVKTWIHLEDNEELITRNCKKGNGMCSSKVLEWCGLAAMSEDSGFEDEGKEQRQEEFSPSS